jgi:hypothetical protein
VFVFSIIHGTVYKLGKLELKETRVQNRKQAKGYSMGIRSVLKCISNVKGCFECVESVESAGKC